MNDEILSLITELKQPKNSIGTAGIYFLFRESVLVYIGQSGWCESRINGHLRRGVMDYDSHHIMPWPGSRADRGRLEKELIVAFRPEYNLASLSWLLRKAA